MVLWSGWCPAISNQIMCYSNAIQTKMLTQREITMSADDATSVSGSYRRRRRCDRERAFVLDGSFSEKQKNSGCGKHAHSYIHTSIRAAAHVTLYKRCDGTEILQTLALYCARLLPSSLT